MNVVLDDAFNLGWKLAATVRAAASGHLLETYHSERHAEGRRVLENTQAQVLLAENSDEMKPLRDFLTRLFSRKEVSLALAELVTGLDTRYECPGQEDTHPWLGRMAPDFAVRLADEDERLSGLLSEGRGLLIDASEGERFIRSIETSCAAIDAVHAESLPQPAPKAMLVRPDGHVAWVAAEISSDVNKLREAIAYWFGTSRQECR